MKVLMLVALEMEKSHKHNPNHKQIFPGHFGAKFKFKFIKN